MQLISRLVLTFLLNAAWLTVVVAATAWCCACLIRHAPARWLHRLWVSAVVLVFLLPLWSALKGVHALDFSYAAVVRFGLPARPDFREFFAYRLPKSVSLAPLWMAALAGLYFFLLLGRALWIVRAWLTTRRLSASASVGEPPPFVTEMAGGYCSILGVSRVSLLFSSLVRSPLTLGFSSPKIVLPHSVWHTAGDEEWASILSHELAHICRHDLIKNLAYELLLWPVFFHPAAAFIKRQIGRTRELACDEMATDRLVHPAMYARSLVKLAGIASGHPGSATPTYGLSISDPRILEERVMKLLHHHRRFGLQARALLALAFSIFIALSVSVAAFAVVVAEKPKASAATASGNAPGSTAQENKTSDSFTKPRPISTPEPEYPQDEKAANNPGTVSLAIVVGADGYVHDWKVLSSSSKSFEEAAVSAVRQWTFEPGLKDGTPVTVELQVSVEFLLHKDKSSTSEAGE